MSPPAEIHTCARRAQLADRESGVGFALRTGSRPFAVHWVTQHGGLIGGWAKAANTSLPKVFVRVRACSFEITRRPFEPAAQGLYQRVRRDLNIQKQKPLAKRTHALRFTGNLEEIQFPIDSVSPSKTSKR